jgi:hypothetical protein
MPLFFVVLPRVLGSRLEIGSVIGVGAILLFVIGSVWESLPPPRRRWLYHPASLMVLMLLIPPLFKSLEDPTPMLSRLYAVFGGTMRRHDVPAAKVIAGVLIAYLLVYLVAVYRYLWPTFFPKRAKAPTPPGAARPVELVADEGLAAAREQVRGPAVGLIATGVLNWIAMFVAVGVLYYFKFHRNADMPDWVFILVMPILTFGSGMILFGALKMMRLESFAWANAASILAMIIGPGYLIGWPVGIWSLVTLARPEVQAGFRRRREAWRSARGRADSEGAPAVVARPAARAALWIVALLALIGFLPYNESHEGGTTRTTIGLVDPWFVSVSGQSSRVNLFTWSALFGLIALVCGLLLGRGSQRAAPGAAPDQYTLLPDRRRFSRAALVGAIFAPLPLLLMPSYFLSTDVPDPISQVSRQALSEDAAEETVTTMTTTAPTPTTAARAEPLPEHAAPRGGGVATSQAWLAGLLILAMGVAPPLVTTILGLVAIGQIRASRGRLYGLPLAVADALLYPLLAIDLLLGVFWSFALPHDGAVNWRGVVVLTVITSAIIDVWLVRLCWRGASSPAAPERIAYGS